MEIIASSNRQKNRRPSTSNEVRWMNHPPQAARRSSRAHIAERREIGEFSSSVVMSRVPPRKAPYCSTSRGAGGQRTRKCYHSQGETRSSRGNPFSPLEVRSMTKTLFGGLTLLATLAAALPAAAGNLYIP